MTSARPRRPARAGPAAARASVRRLETWVWTGPIGHLAGGTIDFVHALARYLLARARNRGVR